MNRTRDFLNTVEVAVGPVAEAVVVAVEAARRTSEESTRDCFGAVLAGGVGGPAAASRTASVCTRQGGAGRSSCAGQLVALGGRRQGPVDLGRGGVAGGPSTSSDAGGLAGGAGSSAWGGGGASSGGPPLCPSCVAESDGCAQRHSEGRAEP